METKPWEDTVMKQPRIKELWNEHDGGFGALAEITQAQAEISFKVGIGEVIDDIVKELDYPFSTPKWRILEHVEICIGGWQKKLEEWGIKQ